MLERILVRAALFSRKAPMTGFPVIQSNILKNEVRYFNIEVNLNSWDSSRINKRRFSLIAEIAHLNSSK